METLMVEEVFVARHDRAGTGGGRRDEVVVGEMAPDRWWRSLGRAGARSRAGRANQTVRALWPAARARQSTISGEAIRVGCVTAV